MRGEAMTQRSEDRARAMRALMPRAGSELPKYDSLTRSARAEVDRIVAAFVDVRREAVADVLRGQ